MSNQFCVQRIRQTAWSVLVSAGVSGLCALPVYAGPDFGMHFGNGGGNGNDMARMQIQQNFNRGGDNRPNIQIQVPVIAPQIDDSVSRGGGKQNFAIENIMTRVINNPTPDISTRIPQMPTISIPTPQIDISSKQINITPNIDRSVQFTPPPVQVTTVSTPASFTPDISSRTSAANPPTISVLSAPNARDTDDSGRANSRQLQVAAVQPAVNQTGPTDTGNGASPQLVQTTSQPQEVQAQVFTGKGVGNVVTSDFVNDPTDREGIKKELNGRLALFEGTTLFIPEKDMVVQTKHGDVNIAGHSVVLVSSSADEVAVYDVHDHKKGSVSIKTQSGKTLTLAPGRHVVISTDQSGDFAMANALEIIPHRDVSHAKLEESKSVYSSEFSVLAAINSVNALKSLATSTNPELQKVSHKIMKTAAILMYMGNPNYKHYLRPRVTLLSQN